MVHFLSLRAAFEPKKENEQIKSKTFVLLNASQMLHPVNVFFRLSNQRFVRSAHAHKFAYRSATAVNNGYGGKLNVYPLPPVFILLAPSLHKTFFGFISFRINLTLAHSVHFRSHPCYGIFAVLKIPSGSILSTFTS